MKQLPDQHATKEIPAEVPILLYVGSIRPDKGVDDIIDAAHLAMNRGIGIHTYIVGAGAYLPALKDRAAKLGAAVDFLGTLNNEEVFRLMRQSTIVCVPSRHEFTEGMPFVITEALASRTPVVLSDHPIFKRAFTENEGVRFYRSRDPESLVRVISELLAVPAIYAGLSDTTAVAFARVCCSITFREVVNRWRTHCGLDALPRSIPADHP